MKGWVASSAVYYCIHLSVLAAHIGPAVCLLAVPYVGCNRMTAVAMMILALTFNGAACQTSLQNHQDLAPNFAGSLYGVMNTFGSFSGFIIPAVIGALTNEHVRIYLVASQLHALQNLNVFTELMKIEGTTMIRNLNKNRIYFHYQQ